MRKTKEVKKTVDKRLKEEAQVKETMRCPFCGNEFMIKDLVFAISSDSAEVEIDHIYRDFMEEQFLPTGKNLNRRLLFMHQWDESNVRAKDVGGIPLIVEGEFFMPEKKSLSSFDLGFDDPLDDASSFGFSEPSQKAPSKKKSITTESVYRLCPQCHCELPDGLGSYREIVIGMYGGTRSGKTTYMSVAATYMCDHMGSMGLGDTAVIEESRVALRELYNASVSAQGAPPTQKGKRCFPIGLFVTPSNNDYKPFFLFFQDIPGEAAVVGDDTLVHHPFTQANAFLGIVDINMFVRTREKESIAFLESSIDKLEKKPTPPFFASNQNVKEDLLKEIEQLGQSGCLESVIKRLEEKANQVDFSETSNAAKELRNEMERLGLSICSKTRKEIFSNPMFAKHMKNLQSVQLVLSKIDRWKTAALEEQKELIYCSELLHDHTHQHEQAIDALHLKYVDKQIRSIIRLFPNADITTTDGNKSMLEWLVDILGGSKHNYHQAYTGVSSVPGISDGIAAIDQSENILDPIFNICRWEGLLPVKQK